jgi:hypothetical protein
METIKPFERVPDHSLEIAMADLKGNLDRKWYIEDGPGYDALHSQLREPFVYNEQGQLVQRTFELRLSSAFKRVRLNCAIVSVGNLHSTEARKEIEFICWGNETYLIKGKYSFQSRKGNVKISRV